MFQGLQGVSSLLLLLLLLLLLSSSSSSSSNFLLLSFSWEIFTYPGIQQSTALGWCSDLQFRKFLTIEHVPRITDFCICVYVFGCKLSLSRLCDSDFGITPVDYITVGMTCAAFCFHIAHISFASSWYIIIIIIIIIITIMYT